MIKFDKKLLWNLLSQPTAPFREGHVARFVTEFGDREKIEYFKDPHGNLVVGADSKESYLNKLKKATHEPVRFFIAHMDHPGFHGVKWVTPTTLQVKWLGGTPRKFLNGARVWLSTSEGVFAEGTLSKSKLNKSDTALESSLVVMKNERAKALKVPAQDIFGAFAFSSPVWEKQKVVYTKAADDLVGVFAILSLAKHFKGSDIPFLGLISRAEEVGFIGTVGHFELEWLTSHKESVAVISLETSRTLPGALIGKGPVVRLGDRATPFDPGLVQVLTQVAEKSLRGKFQRRMMDGGTCEATAALAFGLRAMGISIPLGNYHNQSFEGGPESAGEWGPAPEFVHLEDIKRMLILCEALMAPGLSWRDPWSSRRESFISSRKKSEEILKTM